MAFLARPNMRWRTLCLSRRRHCRHPVSQPLLFLCYPAHNPDLPLLFLCYPARNPDLPNIKCAKPSFTSPFAAMLRRRCHRRAAQEGPGRCKQEGFQTCGRGAGWPGKGRRRGGSGGGAYPCGRAVALKRCASWKATMHVCLRCVHACGPLHRPSCPRTVGCSIGGVRQSFLLTHRQGIPYKGQRSAH